MLFRERVVGLVRDARERPPTRPTARRIAIVSTSVAKRIVRTPAPEWSLSIQSTRGPSLAAFVGDAVGAVVAVAVAAAAVVRVATGVSVTAGDEPAAGVALVESPSPQAAPSSSAATAQPIRSQGRICDIAGGSYVTPKAGNSSGYFLSDCPPSM